MSGDSLVDPSELGTDAAKWAAAWAQTAIGLVARGEPIIDEGWMIGWFANAMAQVEMAARSKGSRTEMEHLLDGCVAGWDKRLSTHEVTVDICSTCGKPVEYTGAPDG